MYQLFVTTTRSSAVGAGVAITTYTVEFESYYEAEHALKLLRDNKPDDRSIARWTIRLYKLEIKYNFKLTYKATTGTTKEIKSHVVAESSIKARSKIDKIAMQCTDFLRIETVEFSEAKDNDD